MPIMLVINHLDYNINLLCFPEDGKVNIDIIDMDDGKQRFIDSDFIDENWEKIKEKADLYLEKVRNEIFMNMMKSIVAQEF
jgi:hypothetical protein